MTVTLNKQFILYLQAYSLVYCKIFLKKIPYISLIKIKKYFPFTNKIFKKTI